MKYGFGIKWGKLSPKMTPNEETNHHSTSLAAMNAKPCYSRLAERTKINKHVGAQLLQHAALRENYKKKHSAGEMYSTICVEWAVDHFGLFDVHRSTFN